MLIDGTCMTLIFIRKNREDVRTYLTDHWADDNMIPIKITTKFMIIHFRKINTLFQCLSRKIIIFYEDSSHLLVNADGEN